MTDWPAGEIRRPPEHPHGQDDESPEMWRILAAVRRLLADIDDTPTLTPDLRARVGALLAVMDRENL